MVEGPAPTPNDPNVINGTFTTGETVDIGRVEAQADQDDRPEVAMSHSISHDGISSARLATAFGVPAAGTYWGRNEHVTVSDAEAQGLLRPSRPNQLGTNPHDQRPAA